VRGFLLDSHVTAAVVPGVRRALPSCEIDHLSTWRGGAFLHASDESIILAASNEDLVFVTYDVHSVPPLVHRMVAEGRPPVGIALGVPRVIRPSDAGKLISVLVRLFAKPFPFDPAYPVVYLRPSPKPSVKERRGRKGVVD